MMPESMTVDRSSICGVDAGPRCPRRNRRKFAEKRYFPEEQVEVLEPDLVPDLPAEKGELRVRVEGGREPARQND
jgi:hypothetical protein